ncbi:hypothetical protein [Chlamydiifrater phoenicopteri]|uniref:hypothetical protein n=1 Tax=Chlamydiifrater phoenicopteri TaxID=2681469 RepID=UPI001BD0E2EB|nr:hypothetical protein [Chlamydiifrater phoenicopteri]
MFSHISLACTNHKHYEDLSPKEKVGRIAAVAIDILLFPIVAIICGIVGSLIFILKTLYGIIRELLHRITCKGDCSKETLYKRVWGRVNIAHFTPSFMLMLPILGIGLYWLVRKSNLPDLEELNCADYTCVLLTLSVREAFSALEEKAPQPCLANLAASA